MFRYEAACLSSGNRLLASPPVNRKYNLLDPQRLHSLLLTSTCLTWKLTMVPFTWGFMMPTNNTLFRLHEESEALSTSLGGLAEAQALLRKWSWLHLVRSCFPLAGAVIGLFATLE